jgi:hypothetical protein
MVDQEAQIEHSVGFDGQQDAVSYLTLGGVQHVQHAQHLEDR